MMIKTTIVLTLILSFLGCESTKSTNLPEIKASRNEAVVVAQVDLQVGELENNTGCGSSSCMAYLKISEVKELGQSYQNDLKVGDKILTYFSFGTNGADSTTHTGLMYDLPKLKTGTRISAVIEPTGEVKGEMVYTVSLYTKL